MAEIRFNAESRLRPAEDIVFRVIAGEVVLVPVHRSAVDIGSIYTLNASGARVWALLDGQRTLGQIRDTMVAEYEVERDQAWANLVTLVKDLLRAGALREV